MELNSAQIAEFTKSVSFDQIPNQAAEYINQLVFDSIGCCFGAYASPPSKALRATYGKYHSNNADATIFGTENSIPVEYAGLINSTMVRYLDYNDAYIGQGGADSGACHPSDHIPSLISIAETHDATGKDLIEAIVVAYEIEGAGVDSAILRDDTAFDYVSWGAYSSTAAVGKLMDLSEDELIDAIGIAGTSSSGALKISRSGDISMWKGVAHPYVTHNAIQACQMAKNGLTGPSAVFEGPQGFGEAAGTTISIDGLGIEDNGYFRVSRSNIKSFACGFWMQAIVEAVQTLLDQHKIDSEEIEKIKVGTFRRAMGLADEEKWKPPLTRETADHSIPYTVSVAFIDGTVGPEQYSPTRLEDPAIHSLMEKVTVEEVEDLNRYRDENPTEIPQIIQVTTSDGSFETRVDTPKGHWKNPMSDTELESKFENQTKSLLTQKQIAGIKEKCYNLSSLVTMDNLVEDLVI